MILILKKIAASTLVPDIEDFVGPAIKGGFLRKSGRIESVIIQKLERGGKKDFEYNALVRIEPSSAAKRAIKMLNRKSLNGKHINVAEFHLRLRGNDRRVGRYKKLDDRRRADRRRLNLVVVDVTEQRKTAQIDQTRFGWSSDITL